MAKLYQKGDCYRLYYNNGGTYAAPTWVWVEQATNIEVDPAPADISVPARGISTGHRHGQQDMMFAFQLLEDAADQIVENLISALINDSNVVHLAVARGDLNDSGIVYWHCECVIFGGLTADDGAVVSYDMEARRHAKSLYNLVRAQTVPALP